MQPPPSHFCIRPSDHEVRAIPQNAVIVVAQDRESEHINCKEPSEKLHTFLNLLFASRVVFTGMLIDATEKLSATTSLLNVINPN
jgi:hypothetical protein